MEVRVGWLGLFGVALAALALAPASASAAEVPVLSSMTPNEIGSNGGQKVILHGEHFTATSVVVYAELRLKVKATGTAAKDESRDISATEIEIDPPLKEHGKRLVKVCNVEPAPEACSSETLEPEHNQMTIWDEVYRNEVAVGGGHVPVFGYGQLLVTGPEGESSTECVSVGFGAAWNSGLYAEPLSSENPTTDHGEILGWWASGHAPKGEHSELTNSCRFIIRSVPAAAPVAPRPVIWVSAEPPLNQVIQEGIVCEATGVPLSSCLAETERVQIAVIRSVSREAPSVPWNVQITERSERLRAWIGVPQECKNGSAHERTELSKCPEASEQEQGHSAQGCKTPPVPAPRGCVRIQTLSNPPLNIHRELEGYLEPRVITGGANGLSPSQWEFEGGEKGEPMLHVRENPLVEYSVTGSVKTLGFSGQELITAK